ncbi:hypothetical protein PHMEG_00019386 [Phytophthora megakarya]|uniref:Uncharacterized protein n=1 Tax=Phytophthora megakarya TaxID=4795 RepID=A0A225VSX6_9STRA|nr:hypothetical protein PHMEG_00019386 [Phytophthora megakarya]
MNAIFFSDNAEDTGDTEPPIILLFVQIENQSEAFVLKPGPEVLAARKHAECLWATATVYNQHIPSTIKPLQAIRMD